MTSTIGSVPDRIDQQQLVEAARADGVELVGPGGLLSGLTKTVLETALEAEMTEHLGYDRHDPTGRDGGNSRNGTRTKTVLTEIGPVQIEVPRERMPASTRSSCASANDAWTGSTNPPRTSTSSTERRSPSPHIARSRTLVQTYVRSDETAILGRRILAAPANFDASPRAAGGAEADFAWVAPRLRSEHPPNCHTGTGFSR